MENFPSNSHKNLAGPAKPVQEERTEKVEKVIAGEAVRRKKPLGRRFKDIFVGADSKSVLEHVVMDVLIPAARDTIYDAGQEALQRKLYGDGRPGSRRGGSARPSESRATYHSMFKPEAGAVRGRPDPRQEVMSRRGRAVHDFDEIILPSRYDADEVLEKLYNIISKYDVVSVADLYSACGITPDHTDFKWGWTSIADAGIARIRSGGYVLNLPRPEPIGR